MNRFIFIFCFFPFIGYGQFTYVPDDNFEQELINLGFDFVIDDNVETSAIDTVSSLYINNLGIEDLTGIEDFIALKDLFCSSNQLTTLNLTNNTQLFEVSCGSNLLTSLDVRNGNNQGLWYFNAMNNPSLNCIDVSDTAWANSNWAKDTWTSFSLDCNPTAINEVVNTNKRLIKVIDVFGRSVTPKANMPLVYIYSDGSREKKLIIK
jgi:Leucine-rich repeat (LRR) protein